MILYSESNNDWVEVGGALMFADSNDPHLTITELNEAAELYALERSEAIHDNLRDFVVRQGPIILRDTLTFRKRVIRTEDEMTDLLEEGYLMEVEECNDGPLVLRFESNCGREWEYDVYCCHIFNDETIVEAPPQFAKFCGWEDEL